MKVTDFNYRDNFEKMLQETADRFYLDPPVHVWKSIYNNFHPSSRWPSLSTWMLFSAWLLLFSLPVKKTGQVIGESGTQNYSAADHSFNKAKVLSGITIGKIHPISQSSPVTYVQKELRAKKEFKRESVHQTIQSVNIHASQTQASGSFDAISFSKTHNRKRHFSLHDPLFRKKLLNRDQNHSYPFNAKQNSRSLTSEPAELPGESVQEPGKLSYEIYATPAFGFRTFSKYPDQEPTGQGSEKNEPSTQQKSFFQPVFSMEAGGNIMYDLNDFMRFKAGLQVNYSRQQMQPDGEVENPTADNSPAPSFQIPVAAGDNLYSGRMLSNQSYRFSIPLGADVKIADVENIEWYAGASVQPSFLIPGGNMFAGADNNDPLIAPVIPRNWNINGGIETFISVHTKGGITLNAGPQLRYQLLSTFRNLDPFNERLYNLGIKLGISSRF